MQAAPPRVGLVLPLSELQVRNAMCKAGTPCATKPWRLSEAQPPAEAAAKPKKRRVLLTRTRLAAPAGQLDCRPTVELSAATSVSLNLPLAKTEVVNGSDQFCLLLQREAESALQTHEQWARSPHAAAV